MLERVCGELASVAPHAVAKGTCSCSDASALSCSVLQKQMNQRASRHGARATKGCSERLTSAPAAALQVCQTELPSTKILHLLALAPLHETRSQAHREERRSKCLSTKHHAPLLGRLQAVGGTISGAFFLTNEKERERCQSNQHMRRQSFKPAVGLVPERAALCKPPFQPQRPPGGDARGGGPWNTCHYDMCFTICVCHANHR